MLLRERNKCDDLMNTVKTVKLWKGGPVVGRGFEE